MSANSMVNVKRTSTGSVIQDMANKYGMDARRYEAVVRATCMPSKNPISNEEFAAFMLMARDYDLNPITKQIYAFPTRSGGIQPIVSVDGWAHLINTNPACDGIEFENHLDENGKLEAITCKIYRKGWSRPVSVTEWMSECSRGNSEPWKSHPRRMLRHKALIQAGRVAFGLGGIVDLDEADAGEYIEITPDVALPKREDFKSPQPEINQELPSYLSDSLDDGSAHSPEAAPPLDISDRAQSVLDALYDIGGEVDATNAYLRESGILDGMGKANWKEYSPDEIAAIKKAAGLN